MLRWMVSRMSVIGALGSRPMSTLPTITPKQHMKPWTNDASSGDGLPSLRRIRVISSKARSRMLVFLSTGIRLLLVGGVVVVVVGPRGKRRQLIRPPHPNLHQPNEPRKIERYRISSLFDPLDAQGIVVRQAGIAKQCTKFGPVHLQALAEPLHLRA